MKNIRKLLSVCFAVLLLLVTIGSPVSATLPLDADDTITPIQMNELGAQSAIRMYFAQREAFLKGESDTIPIAYAPVARDEQAHLEQIISCGLQLISSSITFDTISCWDNTAEVFLTETVVYRVDGEETSCTIPHTIIVFLISNGQYEVGSDGYYDSSADFYSCAYVPPESVTTNVATSGSSLCILDIASNEVGVEEDSNGNTKYHPFFNFSQGEAWCAAFVAWCANQANVSTLIIPETALVNEMKSFMQERNNYYPSKSVDPNSTFSPQAGDLFFFYNPTPNDWKNHIGFVVGVEGDHIRVIDGNWNSQVCNRRVSLTEPLLIGFGRPQYGTTGHTYLPGWSHDGFCHWKQCANCTHKINVGEHIFVQQSPIAPYVCQTCGYRTTTSGGIMRFAQHAINK